jgi:hypothetical protein
MRREFDFDLAFVLGDYIAGALVGLLARPSGAKLGLGHPP